MADRPSDLELLTPRGPGGVAVLALSGADRLGRAAEWLRTRAGAPVASGARPRLANLCLDGEVIDQVLVVDRPTMGVLELHLHGSPLVLERFERHVGGFRPARHLAATMARDATLSAQLWRAETRAQVALVLEQQLLSLAGFFAGIAALPAAARLAELRRAVARSAMAAALGSRFRLVICGAQNAGKSTLLNRLLVQERVLTGALPGLTRDPVRATTVLGGYPFELVDTAGEPDEPDQPDELAVAAQPPPAVGSAIDQAALELARQARELGHRLLVVDGSRLPTAADRSLRNGRTIVLRSKSDLPAADWPAGLAADLAVTCLDPAAAPAIRSAVGEALRRWRGLPVAGPAGGFAAVTAAELEALRSALRGTLEAAE